MVKNAAAVSALVAGAVLGAGGWTAAGPAGVPTAARTAAMAGHTQGVVVSKVALKVRSKPTVYSDVVALLRPQQYVLLNCVKRGGWVQGNPEWYRLQGAGGWVSARYVHNLQPVRAC
ncbi:SH3 domain-containing protein [Streptomyces sp. NPDC007369]|uniref:SH3 domain-containing protein n=1 Tax=Streptomyces sp. NPDC007369 TaxID=3154589 RepID=UPI0033D62649